MTFFEANKAVKKCCYNFVSKIKKKYIEFGNNNKDFST